MQFSRVLSGLVFVNLLLWTLMSCQQQSGQQQSDQRSENLASEPSPVCDPKANGATLADSCDDASQEAVNPVKDSNQNASEASFSGPYCKDLQVPSWDASIQAIASRLCERCHNDSFAWNGVKLHTYESFVENAISAEDRIRTENLSFELRVIDKINFLDWFEAGMPRTEKDCVSLGEGREDSSS